MFMAFTGLGLRGLGPLGFQGFRVLVGFSGGLGAFVVFRAFRQQS